MALTDQISHFHTYLESEKRYSSHTCISYVGDVEQCAQFLQTTYESDHWDVLNHSQLRSWFVSLAQKGLKARSINRKISSVKTFFTFLKKQGLIRKNPARKLVSLKSEKRLPATVDGDAIDRLINHLASDDSFESLRDLLMIELFYQTGVRRAELLQLKHQDIDIRAQRLKVLGKGGKQRIIPIGSGLVELIRRYEGRKQKQFPGQRSPYLVVTDKGNQAYPKFIYNRINRLLSIVSTADNRHPHVLRHTFATQLTNHGADLNAIKELLGHESLAATQVYTHNSIEKLKKAYRQAHPKS